MTSITVDGQSVDVPASPCCEMCWMIAMKLLQFKSWEKFMNAYEDSSNLATRKAADTIVINVMKKPDQQVVTAGTGEAGDDHWQRCDACEDTTWQVGTQVI